MGYKNNKLILINTHFFRIIIDNSVNADEHSALVIVKTKSSMSYKMSSFSEERFKEVQHGKYVPTNETFKIVTIK